MQPIIQAISTRLCGKHFNVMNIQVYVATTDAEEKELMCFVIKLNLIFIEHAKKTCCLWLDTEFNRGLT